MVLALLGSVMNPPGARDMAFTARSSHPKPITSVVVTPWYDLQTCQISKVWINAAPNRCQILFLTPQQIYISQLRYQMLVSEEPHFFFKKEKHNFAIHDILYSTLYYTIT